MKHVYVGDLEFPDRQSFNSEQEAREFKKKLGDRYINTTKVEYPDCELWIVTFKTEDPVVQTQQALSR